MGAGIARINSPGSNPTNLTEQRQQQRPLRLVQLPWQHVANPVRGRSCGNRRSLFNLKSNDLCGWGHSPRSRSLSRQGAQRRKRASLLGSSSSGSGTVRLWPRVNPLTASPSPDMGGAGISAAASASSEQSPDPCAVRAVSWAFTSAQAGDERAAQSAFPRGITPQERAD